MNHTGEVRTKRSFNRQADPKAGTDQAFDAFATYIMSHHFWPVCWRGKFGDNQVMNLMSGITLAQQKRFALEFGPMTISLVTSRWPSGRTTRRRSLQSDIELVFAKCVSPVTIAISMAALRRAVTRSLSQTFVL
jgi:hypothetical protein